MSATPDIIAQVRAAGGQVMMIEGRLKVRAPLPLPDKLVAELRLNKADVMAFLQDRKVAWTPEDWRVFFDERAGIAEHNGGLPRPDAERRAFECCVVELLWRNPPPTSGPERCAHCDNGLGEYDGVPFLTGDGGHVWLHSGCHGEWMAHRRQVATETLMRMGIRLAAHPKGKID